jgi:hypothetical protein
LLIHPGKTPVANSGSAIDWDVLLKPIGRHREDMMAAGGAPEPSLFCRLGSSGEHNSFDQRSFSHLKAITWLSIKLEPACIPVASAVNGRQADA